jgi:hypothetical protein
MMKQAFHEAVYKAVRRQLAGHDSVQSRQEGLTVGVHGNYDRINSYLSVCVTPTPASGQDEKRSRHFCFEVTGFKEEGVVLTLRPVFMRELQVTREIKPKTLKEARSARQRGNKHEEPTMVKREKALPTAQAMQAHANMLAARDEAGLEENYTIPWPEGFIPDEKTDSFAPPVPNDAMDYIRRLDGFIDRLAKGMKGP